VTPNIQIQFFHYQKSEKLYLNIWGRFYKGCFLENFGRFGVSLGKFCVILGQPGSFSGHSGLFWVSLGLICVTLGHSSPELLVHFLLLLGQFRVILCQFGSFRVIFVSKRSFLIIFGSKRVGFGSVRAIFGCIWVVLDVRKNEIFTLII